MKISTAQEEKQPNLTDNIPLIKVESSRIKLKRVSIKNLMKAAFYRDSFQLQASELINKSEDLYIYSKAFTIYKMQCNIPARIRAFATREQRDLGRFKVINSYPEGNHGLYFDAVFEADLLEINVCPSITVIPVNDELPLIFDGKSNQAISLTLSILRIEI